MLDAEALLKKHAGRGVFIDTNLLVLLLVGRVNAARIRNFKRTRDFTVEDFRLLQRLLKWFGRPIFTTPHVLSQVSDLTDLPAPEFFAARDLFSATIQEVDERYDTAQQLVQHPLFKRFGLGDASVAAVCQRDILVLTADLRLQLALQANGLDALNSAMCVF